MAELVDCAARGNTDCGALVRDAGSSVWLARCAAVSNALSGLAVEEGASAEAADCEMSQNGQCGVLVKGEGSRLAVKRCASRGNARDGFVVKDEGAVTVSPEEEARPVRWQKGPSGRERSSREPQPSLTPAEGGGPSSYSCCVDTTLTAGCAALSGGETATTA